MLAFSYFASYFNLFKTKRFSWHKSDNYEKLPRKPGLLCFFTLAIYDSRDRFKYYLCYFCLPNLILVRGQDDLVEMLMLLALTAAIVTIGILPGAIHLMSAEMVINSLDS